MNRLFKIVASRAGRVVFDDRVEAATPRVARETLRERLGLSSLTGVVYAITEIPVELIHEIVNARIAEVLSSTPGQPPIDLNRVIAATVEDAVATRLRQIDERLGRIESAAPSEPRRFDAFRRPQSTDVITCDQRAVTPPATVAVASSEPDWAAIREFYRTTGSPKQTAARFDLSINTVKARIQREGWTTDRQRATSQPARRTAARTDNRTNRRS